MRKIKVLHVITRLITGGADENTMLTVEGLDKENYELCLAVGEEHEKSLLKRVEKSKVKTVIFPNLKRSINPIHDFLAMLKLSRFIKKEDFDIVHTHESKAGILGRAAAKLAKTPLIIHTIHGFGFTAHQPAILRNFLILLERAVARFTDKFITVSKLNIEKAREAKIGKEHKFVTIHSGIKLDKFLNTDVDVARTKEKLGINSEHPVVGMIARLENGKGHKYFLEAASEVAKVIPEAKFLIVGDGLLKNGIENLVDELNLSENVIMPGFTRNIPEIVVVLDVSVLPSLWEGLPRVIPEAMIAAKPVIATPVDGIPEAVIDQKTGLLVPVKDSKALAQAIITLLKDKEKAKKMGEAGREYIIREFNADEMVKDIARVYEELIKEKLCTRKESEQQSKYYRTT